MELRRRGFGSNSGGPNWEIWKLGKYSVPAVLESSLFGSGFSLLFLEQLSSPGASRRDEGGAVSALSSRFPNYFSEISTVFGAARAGLELSQNWDRPRDSRSFPGREGRVCPKGFGTSALNPAQSAPSQLCQQQNRLGKGIFTGHGVIG